MAEQRKGVSFNPKTFVSGGLLDDVDVTLKNACFEMFDYDGKADPAPALGIDLVTGEEADDEKPMRQHWSCGSAESWAPSDDKMELVPIGKDSVLRKTTNLAMLFKSCTEAGMPDAILDTGRASIFEDLKVHVRRVDAPKRGNLPTGGVRRGRDGKDYEKDNKILCIEKIYEPFPWDVKKPAGKAAGKKSAEPKAEPTASDIDAKAKAVLIQLIAAGEGKTSKKEIPTKGFVLLDKNDPDMNKVFGCLLKDPWITANGFQVAADGTITLA